MNKNLLFALLVLMVTGCSQSPRISEVETVVYNPDDYTNLFTSGLFSKITLVPLETSSECLIGAIPRLYSSPSGFYIVDFYKQQNAYRFDLDGKFLNSVGRLGGGPGEYSGIVDFAVEKDGVHIYTGDKTEEFVYSFSGDFLSKKAFDYRSLGAIPAGDGTWLYLGYLNQDQKERIVKVDTEGKFVMDTLKADYNIMTSEENTPVFTKYGDRIYQRNIWSNQVYLIEGQQIYPLYEFDMGKYQIPQEYYNYASPIEAAMSMLSSSFGAVKRFMQNDHFAITEVYVQRPEGIIMANGIKNLRTKEWRWFNVDMNRETNALFFWNVQDLTPQDELICLAAPSALIHFPNQEIFENSELISTLKEEDNPVVIKCTLKR